MQGAHWYAPDGTPKHTVPKANGDGDRATTISDARKFGWLPSVTGVLNVLDKPALATWKAQQVARAALANPKQPDESEDYWIKRVCGEAETPAAEAADLGSKIHAALESAMAGEPYPDELRVYVQPVIDWREATGIIISEREIILVNPAHGFAGCADVLFRYGKSGRGILDYKTRKTTPGKAVTPYDGQAMQLAAYAATFYGEEVLPQVLAANVYISTTEPGRVDICKHDDLVGHWEAFKAAAHLWRYLKGYDPRKAGA
jgi:hypothetical protein